MEADIKILEDKIIKLIAFCVRMREENAALRDDLTKSEQMAHALKSKVNTASAKLEQLLLALPADTETE